MKPHLVSRDDVCTFLAKAPGEFRCHVFVHCKRPGVSLGMRQSLVDDIVEVMLKNCSQCYKQVFKGKWFCQNCWRLATVKFT